MWQELRFPGLRHASEISMDYQSRLIYEEVRVKRGIPGLITGKWQPEAG